MSVFSRLRLRTKLVLLIGLATLALVASLAVSASVIRQRMISDRVDKLHAVVDMSTGLAQLLENQVAAHKLTREQAQEQLRNAVHGMRFDAGDGYVIAETLDDIVFAHGANPALDNKPAPPVKDASGKLLSDMMASTLRNADQGMVAYSYVRPGQTRPVSKVAYISRFKPWGLVFLSGAYADDLNAAFHTALWKLCGVGGLILLVTLCVAWLVDRDITGSLWAVNAAMGRLSGGELDASIPGTDRRDEVGSMAKALLVFKDGLNQAERLRMEHDDERARAQAVKIDALVAMAETIESEARDAMADVGERTDAMAQAANNMKESAGRTGVSAEGAAAAAAQALANAQTVSSAAEELTASIREIGGQVNQSALVVARAVEAGRTARETIGALNEQVGRIGSVAEMIGEIAAKTNLLALNATIEAARAGEAGKGFAVVASEVKQLATQTARSTQEISSHIAEVRGATNASVTAVGQIETTIGEVNAIAGSIAAAVEQQSAATAEIARNIAETASAANQMTERTREVSAEAATTGHDAVDVLANTMGLTDTFHGLRRALVRAVRTSTSEVDRRRFRRRPCYTEASITHAGQTISAVAYDLSEHGCYTLTDARLKAGEAVEISFPRFAKRLSGTVVAQTDLGVHIHLTDSGLPTEEADQISLGTVAELVRVTKADHLAFVKKVSNAASSGEVIHDLATEHACRLGRWYDSLTDPATLALPSFRAIAEPHHAVHACGHQVFTAMASKDTLESQRMLKELQRHSERVLHCLDEFAREYPSTIERHAQAQVRAA